MPDNAARFTPDELVEATGGRWLAPPTRALEGVQLDSRRVAPGNVFVALKGETHDAHDYLPQVMAAGAHAVVVDRDVEAPEGVGVL
ncbi:MAG: UDP-N-acetylmuramoyl-tripeptide--D-alanyl-D-alanine ligase, partial [Sandaracinaceae bacterium]